jgi:LGFP repeat
MTIIETKYEEIGGSNSFLGGALTQEISTPSGLGIYKEFEHGIIYYSADYGACILREKIVNKWKSDSVSKSLVADNKTTIQDYLGFPVGDSVLTQKNTTTCFFERGMIVSTDNVSTSFVVYGAIYITYRKNDSINGWMGLPISDENISNNGGRVSFFEQADIYWHPNVGSFEVHGAIREKYNKLGGSGSHLGYPTSNESDILKEKKKIGKINNFEFGNIYWGSNTGAFEMHGPLVAAYTKDFGGPSGELGLPTSDELRSPKDIVRFNNFQNGVLTFNTQNDITRKITNLKVVITKLHSDEDDDDLIVETNTTLTVFGNQQASTPKRFGEYSNQGTKGLTEQEGFINNFALRDGNAVINIHMKAIESDGGLNGPDDTIAELVKSFNIDTYWDTGSMDLQGNTLQTMYSGPDGLFGANVRIEIDGVDVDVNDKENFRRNLFWNIHNPKIEKLDFNIFAETFSDVEADDTVGFHPLNHLFYEIYKGTAATGTCFGMCVEAVYALKGRSASRQFISQYNKDEQRLHDFSVKFGYQLGGSQILYMLNKLKLGELWNPVKNFELSKNFFDEGNYPILCLSKGTSISGGHVVLPYDWDTSNPNEWIIKVANPNSPIGEQESNVDGDRVIKINPINNTFSYAHDTTHTWSGGGFPGVGGRMFAIPYCELSSEPRTPIWDVLATFLTGGLYIVFAGDAEIEQISDTDGNHFYDENGDVNYKSDSNIKNLMAVNALSGPGDPPFTDSMISANIGTIAAEFILRKREKAKSFYLKNEKRIEKVYNEQTPSIDSAILSESIFMNHIGTAVASQNFAQNLNSENFNDKVVLLNPLKFENSNSIVKNKDLIHRAIQFSKDRSLVFDIDGKQDGKYDYAITTGKSQIIISSSTTVGTKDQITIDGINTQGQAVTFKAGENILDKKIKLTLFNFNKTIKYELDNISVASGKTFTLQHNNACKEFIIHNSEQPINFNLNIFLNGEEVSSLSKNNIIIEGDKVVHFDPTNWDLIKNKSLESTIKLDFYNHIGGEIIDSITI